MVNFHKSILGDNTMRAVKFGKKWASIESYIGYLKGTKKIFHSLLRFSYKEVRRSLNKFIAIHIALFIL